MGGFIDFQIGPRGGLIRLRALLCKGFRSKQPPSRGPSSESRRPEMFPQFSNPHLRAEEVQITSRAALDDEGPDVDGAARSFHREMVTALEETLKRSFGDVFSGTNPSSEDPVLEPRKKKRRKVHDNANVLDASLPAEPIRE